MSEGWIKLHRSIKDWQHYQEPTVMLVWIDILLSANTKPAWVRGEAVVAGQVVTSVTTIMDSTGIKSKHTVIDALRKLEQSGEIRREKFGNGTKITISNFEKYQGCGAVGGAKNAPRKSKEGTEAVQQEVQKMHQIGAVGGAKNAPKQEYKKEEERIINPTPTPARAHDGVAPIFERPNPRQMDAKTYGTFQNVKLTDSEMQTLRMRLASEGHDEAFLQRCIDRLSAYMAQEGRTYNNHLAAILNWAKVAVLEDDRRTGASQQRPAPKAPTDNDERRRVWFSLTEEERQQYLATHDNKPPYDE